MAEASPSARRKTKPVAKYAVDLSRATSLLPWFQAALQKRVEHLVSDGLSFCEARETALLRLTSLDASTEKGYARVWLQFESFCSEFSHTPMPTSLSTGMAYIRWQAQRGSVHKDTLTGYLSVINCANSDMMFPDVFELDARGRFSKDVSKVLMGLAKVQGKRVRDTQQSERLYLPAEAALKFLHEARLRLFSLVKLSSSELLGNVTVYRELELARDLLAIAFGFGDFGRSQSQAGLTRDDLGFVQASGDLIWQFRDAKGVTKQKSLSPYVWQTLFLSCWRRYVCTLAYGTVWEAATISCGGCLATAKSWLV